MNHGADLLMRLDDALSRGAYAEVVRLLDAGADPNGRDVVGDPMLMNAAWVGAVEIVQLLLDRGADSQARGQHGHTALERVLTLEDPDPETHGPVIALLRRVAQRAAQDARGAAPSTMNEDT